MRPASGGAFTAGASGRDERGRSNGRISQAHAPPASGTSGAFANEFDASILQGADELGQRVDIAAYDAIAGFHALDCRHGQARDFRQSSLIE
jgi:hypothetical protein